MQQTTMLGCLARSWGEAVVSSQGTRAADRELALLHVQAGLSQDLDRVRRPDKALKIGLRTARDFFGADEGCIAVMRPGGPSPELRYLVPSDSEWDASWLAHGRAEARGARPADVAFAPLRRRGRLWGLLVLRRRGGSFDRNEVRELSRFGAVFSGLIQRIDRHRLFDVRARIDRKVMEQLRPKDLFYQILHGLRTLTRYDHSAAVLLHHPGPSTLELVAEQITWRKAKSDRIGATQPLGEEARKLLESGTVYGFDRRGDEWVEWQGRQAGALARALATGVGDRPLGCLLCAPLMGRHGLLGVLSIASSHPGSLGRYEAHLVQDFLPQAVVAIRNLRRAESLELGMLEAEKKHVMANLARGVSHDVNNALGAMLPLVQQMLDDVRHDRLDQDELERDLEQLEVSVQVCRRIFGGMLSFAKGSASSLGQGDLGRAVQSTLSVLAEGLRSCGIAVEVDVPERMPCVRGRQGDLEQLVLNLASNARDAMSDGGRLVIRARLDEDEVLLTISDTGRGIPVDELERVSEPFYSTKPHGNGLGLSICRSIVWELGGRMTIESEPGQGTSLTVRLPAVGEDSP